MEVIYKPVGELIEYEQNIYGDSITSVSTISPDERRRNP